MALSDIEQLYERDFYTWTQNQALALRKAQRERLNTSAPIDWAHLAEEIEEMGISQEHELWSRFRVILVHLLKWEFQPRRRSRSWKSSVVTNRTELDRLLRRNPGLKPMRDALLGDAYHAACKVAATETGLDIARFPSSCPWSVEQVLDDDYWPESEQQP